LRNAKQEFVTLSCFVPQWDWKQQFCRGPIVVIHSREFYERLCYESGSSSQRRKGPESKTSKPPRLRDLCQCAHPWNRRQYHGQQGPERQCPLICHTSKHMRCDKREYQCHYTAFCALARQNIQVKVQTHEIRPVPQGPRKYMYRN
jgi:hypothetical protein